MIPVRRIAAASLMGLLAFGFVGLGATPASADTTWGARVKHPQSLDTSWGAKTKVTTPQSYDTSWGARIKTPR